jgi:uncharacterized ferredoxin-like protein
MLEEASKRAAQGVVNHLTQGTVKTVSSRGGGVATGWDAYAGMTPEQLADRMEGMSEKDALKFMKEAPQHIRDKFPSVPWG